jgi:hypothetical protein
VTVSIRKMNGDMGRNGNGISKGRTSLMDGTEEIMEVCS